MRRFLTILMAVILLACPVSAMAEAAGTKGDMIIGDWTMDYFGIPMVFHFHENGTFEGIIDMNIPVADDGFNGITGLWTFDGKTLTIRDNTGTSNETFNFTWDGEKLSGVMYDTQVFMSRAVQSGIPAAGK